MSLWPAQRSFLGAVRATCGRPFSLVSSPPHFRFQTPQAALASADAAGSREPVQEAVGPADDEESRGSRGSAGTCGRRRRSRRAFRGRRLHPSVTYWVEPGRLLAGPYPDDAAGAGPGGRDHHRRPHLRGRRLARLLERPAAARAPPGRAARLRPPSEEQMRRALGEIDDLLRAGGIVYVHCRGGRGRTGCVVACYLIEQGASAEEALAAVREGSGSPSSPETDEQRRMVSAWRPARAAVDASARPPASSSDA